MTNPLHRFMRKQPVGNAISDKYPEGITMAVLRTEMGMHRAEWQSLRIQGVLPCRSIKISHSKLARLNLEAFSTYIHDNAWIPTHRVVEQLGIPESRFRDLVGTEPAGIVFGYDMWRQIDIKRVKSHNDYQSELKSRSGSRKRFDSRFKTRQDKLKKLEEFEKKASEVVNRVTADHLSISRSEHTVLHLGPTNSGKTYAALEALISDFESGAHGRFVYAGPLRLLASEVFTKLCDRLGKENVGIITGEEALRPEAPVICATVECASNIDDIHTLVIDEAHWALDSARGHKWSKLMLSTSATVRHVIAGLDVKEVLIEALKPDEIIENKRFSKISLGSHGKKTAIIAFSRREVLSIAKEIGPSAIPLYGAMPVDTKKRQINLFNNDNTVTTIVTTDVIGHGLNLPIDTVELTSSTKFDGDSVRRLYDWELAQIIGRAGRRGLSDTGTVVNSTNDMSDEELSNAISIANGTAVAKDDLVRKLHVMPNLEMLGLKSNEAKFLEVAIKKWQELSAVYDKSKYYVAGDVSHLLQVIPIILETAGWRASTKEVWSLANGPFEVSSPALRAGSTWLKTRNPKDLIKAYETYSSPWSDELVDIENAARNITEFRALALTLGLGRDLAGSVTYERMIADERKLSKAASRELDKTRGSV